MELNKRNYKLCFFTGFIAGLILGACIISILINYRLDAAFETIANLEQIINEKNTQLENLEESINSSNYIIKNIDVYLEYDGIEEDPITSLEIEGTIKEKYEALLGKEVRNVDLELLVGVVDKRILKIENNYFQIHIEQLVLSENLKLFIKVTPWGKN